MFLRDIMQKSLVTLSPDSSIREAAKKMKEHGVGCVLVVNGMSLKGIVTDRDIACWLADGGDADGVKLHTIMHSDVVTATPDTDTFDASKIMAESRVRRLPIIEDGRLCGIVTTSDIATVLEQEVDNFFHVEEVYHH